MGEEKETKIEYENCLDIVKAPKQHNSLAHFLEKEEDPIKKMQESDDWENHWIDMPEFEQENKKAFKKIQITFRNEQDYKEFAELIEQNLTPKTKTIWYPKLEKSQIQLKRWVEDESD